MGKPPTTDEELTRRVEALEDRADATDDKIAELRADTDLLIDQTAALNARVTALEALVTEGPPERPPVIGGGPILPPDRPDHTLPVPEPQPPATGSRLVVIELDGYEHPFREEDGTDLGDYVGPHFTQRCIRATCDTLPAFSVMFRPDADGTREEVVFELGYIWNTDPLANLGAYTATIFIGEQEPIVIEAPKHNYYGRWRWQSAPRPVVNNVADLIAAGLLPHYDASVGCGYTPPSTVRTYAGPMDLAGIEPYMPSTGGRDDIGVVTEAQGDYLCTCSPQSLSSLMAQLEGSGTLPWHFRDENTGAPLDIWAYPRCSSRDPNDGNPQPFIPLNWVDSGITLDTSHEPDLGYVPYLLTGDPYALEELQYTVTFNYVCLAPDAKDWYNVTGAVRAHAWSLRCMARAARVTPASVPQWLHPPGYFRKLLDGNRDFVAGRAASTDAPLKEMHILEPGDASPQEWFVEGGCCISTWMEDFEQAVLGHLIEMGFDDWRANYEWKMRATLARIDGVGGWNRYLPFPYKIATRASMQSPYVHTWKECWDLNVSLGSVEEGDPAHMRPETDLNYPMEGLAVLAIAKRLGIAGAAEAHEWLKAELETMYTPQRYIHARWSIA